MTAFGRICAVKRTNSIMKQRKEMIDDERGYFFGFARGTYGEVLSELSKTRVNSWRTSSIPLAEFWQPANLGRIGRLLYKYLPDFNPVCALKFFEFPTDALSDGERIGRPSMTDIMILEAGVQIAVEGKMTEYVRFADKTVREWLNEGVGAADILLRHRILKAWLCYIHNADCTGLEGFADFKSNCMDTSYQFLHRTASACNKAGLKGGTIPVLLYQLFYDANDAEHIQKMEEFKAELRRWAAALKLQNMKFLVISAPVVNMDEVKAHFDGMHGEIFDTMRDESIYRFDFDATTVEAVIDTPEEEK